VIVGVASVEVKVLVMWWKTTTTTTTTTSAVITLATIFLLLLPDLGHFQVVGLVAEVVVALAGRRPIPRPHHEPHHTTNSNTIISAISWSNLDNE